MAYTFQKSRYEEPEKWSDDPNVAPEERMFKTPDHYGYVTTIYNPTKAFEVALTGTYTGSMLVQHMVSSGTDVDIAVETPSFFDLNIKFAYNFTITKFADFEINAGVKNLFNAFQDDFDKGADRDSKYIYGPVIPRSIFFGVKFSLFD